jgi:hypothetical protein
VDQACPGRLEIAEDKIAFVVSKSVFAGRDVLGGSAEWKGVKRASILCHRELWPIRSDKPKKQRFRYGYRRRCFFDFHWYDFYIKSLNIRRLFSYFNLSKTMI